MKKYINRLIIVFLAIVAFSCSEDRLDEINENVNAPTNVGTNLIITDPIVNSAHSVIGSDFAFYASCYIEHNVGIFGQLYNAEIRTTDPSSSTTYNNVWRSIYQNLLNLKDIISKCSAEGSEEGNYHTLGIAQVLTAYNLATLTDAMGDVPWSEALQPGIIFTPVLDSQQDIYANVFQLLTDGIANLQQETVFPSLDGQDPIYGGDADLWLKFANGLMARYKMRLSLRAADYNSVITYANNSFTSADEQCALYYNGSTSKSPFHLFFTDRDYLGASTSLHNKLIARNDPRDDIFWQTHPSADEFLFAPNGTPQQTQLLYAVSAIGSLTAPTFLQSYHEIEFLKAEAYARNNDLPNAKAALKKAVIAACGKENIGISAATAEEYYTEEVEPRLLNQQAALKEIMIQKYIAFFEEEAFEAYCDVRRLKAMGEGDFILLENPLTDRFPLRYTYGASDVTTNANVRDAYGDGSYIYTENVWWAGGSR